MAGIMKEAVAPVREEAEEEIRTLLDGAQAVWAQYKQGQGVRIPSTKELDAFLDSL